MRSAQGRAERFRPTLRRAWVAAVVLSVAGCGTPSTREPANLSLLKAEVRRYVDSGQYERDIAGVAGAARAWLEQRAARRAPDERLTVVFDLDETLFLNWPYMRDHDIGYIPDRWQAWVEAANAPPIAPVREVYHAARRLGCDVVFLTGRTERERVATERNLRGIGCGEFKALICAPDGNQGTAAAFKTRARAELVRQGATIVANIGDQQSDLVGGFAERTFKLPNPFYLTD